MSLQPCVEPVSTELKWIRWSCSQDISVEIVEDHCVRGWKGHDLEAGGRGSGSGRGREASSQVDGTALMAEVGERK